MLLTPYMDDDGNLVVTQGETFVYALNNIKEDNNLIDFTQGWSVEMQARTDGETLLLDLSSTGGEIILGNGTITISESASAMSSLPVGTHRYDIKLTDPDGNVTHWFRRKRFKVLRRVTQ